MPYSKDKTIPAIAGKSEKVKEVFAQAANSALSKGQDEQSAVFAGLAAVKNYEKKQGITKAIIQPKVIPLHIQAIVKAKAASDYIAETKRLELEKQEQTALDNWNNSIARVYVDEEGRLVTVYNSGKKEVSKPLVSETVINRTVVIQQQTEGSGTVLPAEEDMYTKRVDFINDNLFYKGEAAPGSAENAGVWRISLTTLGTDGDVVETWASGNANFTKSWTDRLLYTYS